LRTAVQAYDLIAERSNLEMKVIGGPFIPAASWQMLQEMAQGRQGLSLHKFVTDLPGELRHASASVSQCGYNTAMDIVRSRVPALVVPFANEEEDEQMNRARRLERLGAVRMLDPERLNPQSLAAEIGALLKFQPRPIHVDMNGPENTIGFLDRLLLPRRMAARGAKNGAAHRSPQNWLDPVSRALDALHHPAKIFFRDDDAGWSDERLFQLLDIFAKHGLPLDVAAIPMAVTSRVAQELCRRMTARPESIRVHQHGYAHVNHESAGKKCEFGSARDYFSQRSDIANGKSLLADLLGFAPEPIFTPPWNRCTTITARCLLELGFKVISRDAQAAPLGISGLIELPIEIDWFVHNKKVRLGRGEWGSLLAAKLGNRASVGIM